MNVLIGVLCAILLIMIVFFIYALIKYIEQLKGARPTRDVRKIAIITKSNVNDKKVYIITPKETTKNSPTILYFHGGAYIGGITKFHWHFISHIIKDTKATVIFPDYPLIPKNTYKDVFNMAEQVYNQVFKEHNFIIMGDSAGGGISLALVQKMGIDNVKLPKKIILISPWLDVTMKNEKIDQVQKNDKVLNKITLKLAGEVYASKTDSDNYLVSPLNGPVDKIKNLSIFTGTYDILNPDVHILEERLNKENLFIYEKQGALHNWIIEDMKNSKEDFRILINKILEGEKENI